MIENYQISSISTEYVKVKVSKDDKTSPTSDTVAMAFLLTETSPTIGDWLTAGWQTMTVDGETVYLARCLVGPGGVKTLSPGEYWVWVKVTDNPEIPARRMKRLLEVI